MFCNRCGTQLPPNSLLCPQCGRSLGDPVSAGSLSRLERHLRTLAILWMSASGLFLIPAAALMIIGSSVHFISHGREIFGTDFGPLLLYIAGGSILVLATGGFCVGLGLLQRRPWARTAAIILGVLAILHPPLGTALGAYTLWVLLADGRGSDYRHLTRAA